jgi:hypothetical protein
MDGLAMRQWVQGCAVLGGHRKNEESKVEDIHAETFLPLSPRGPPGPGTPCSGFVADSPVGIVTGTAKCW